MKWTFWTRTQPLILDDCGTIDPLLSLYADGMASAEEARRVETHLPDCAACRESLAWMQATQRALAARPVVSPPADLRARIAAAIAASSAASIPASAQARPARAFVLRPAYAAAASLTVLGVVVGYGLLHHPAPHTAPRNVSAPPMIAAVPSANSSTPGVKSVTGPGVKPPVVHHPTAAPKPARLDPDRVASLPPDEAQPEPTDVKTQAPAAAPKKTTPPVSMTASAKPHVLTIKKPVLPKFKPEMMAVKAPASSIETHKAPVVQPEVRKPETVVATVPHDLPASVPVDVGSPSIKPDPTPTAQVASAHESHATTVDLLSSVKAHVGEMRNAAYSTERKSIKGTILAVSMVDQGRTPGYDFVHGPTH